MLAYLNFINTCILSFWLTLAIAYLIQLIKWRRDPPFKQNMYWLIAIILLVFATNIYITWHDEYLLKNGTNTTISLLRP